MPSITLIEGKARRQGNGELKKIGFDPLFSFNHTAAMLRDSVSRLVRQTSAVRLICSAARRPMSTFDVGKVAQH
jgi:hypothetical protein